MSKNQIYSIISFVMGIVLGLTCCSCQSLITAANITSTIFVRLMQCLAVPIILFSLLSTLIESRKQSGSLRRTFQVTLKYTLGTTILAAGLALLFYKMFDPAKGVAIISSEGVALKGTYMDAVLNIIPKNIFDIFISGNVIGAVIFAVVLASIAQVLPADLSRMLSTGSRLMSEIFLMLARYVMRGLPFFIWAFLFLFIRDISQGFAFSNVATYAGVVLLTNTVHAFITLPLLLMYKGFPFKETILKALPALNVAFFSKSSSVAIPTTLQVCVDALGVRKSVARFTVPVCATINMNGCAAFIFTTSVFMVELFQGPTPVWGLAGFVLVSTMVAVGNAGVPMGCFFMTTSLLSALDVPTYMMGVLLPFFSLLDMYETGINVWSDIVISRCIDKDLLREESQKS